MSLFVTDTSPLLWYARGHHAELSSKALKLFEEADQDRGLIYVPAPVFWEITILIKAGQALLSEPFAQWAYSLLGRRGFDLAPLDLPVITEFLGLGVLADPFDAAIVATARVKDLPLITRDLQIVEANLVDIVW